MQIVIDISEKRFKDIRRIASVQLDSNYSKTPEQIIANGTPLPVTPQPKPGHWIEHEHNGILHIECSECLSWFLRAHLLRNSYCPNCGAKMKKQQKRKE